MTILHSWFQIIGVKNCFIAGRKEKRLKLNERRKKAIESYRVKKESEKEVSRRESEGEREGGRERKREGEKVSRR